MADWGIVVIWDASGVCREFGRCWRGHGPGWSTSKGTVVNSYVIFQPFGLKVGTATRSSCQKHPRAQIAFSAEVGHFASRAQYREPTYVVSAGNTIRDWSQERTHRWSPLLLTQSNMPVKTLRNWSWRPPLPFIYLLNPGHTGGPSVGPTD